MSAHLFIGGVADGRRIETEQHHTFVCPLKIQGGFDTHEYTKIAFRDEDMKVRFVFHWRGDTKTALERLIEGYNPQPEHSPRESA